MTYTITGDENKRNPKWPQLKEFDPENEKFTEYLERVQLYFTANSIAEDKQVAVLLTSVGRKAYALLNSLLSPTKPQEKSFAKLS